MSIGSYAQVELSLPSATQFEQVGTLDIIKQQPSQVEIAVSEQTQVIDPAQEQRIKEAQEFLANLTPEQVKKIQIAVAQAGIRPHAEELEKQWQKVMEAPAGSKKREKQMNIFLKKTTELFKWFMSVITGAIKKTTGELISPTFWVTVGANIVPLTITAFILIIAFIFRKPIVGGTKGVYSAYKKLEGGINYLKKQGEKAEIIKRKTGEVIETVAQTGAKAWEGFEEGIDILGSAVETVGKGAISVGAAVIKTPAIVWQEFQKSGVIGWHELTPDGQDEMLKNFLKPAARLKGPIGESSRNILRNLGYIIKEDKTFGFSIRETNESRRNRDKYRRLYEREKRRIEEEKRESISFKDIGGSGILGGIK